MIIKTRFAPSPTGFLHFGNIRTALFSWLFSQHHKGLFVLRIEDTDYSRSSITYSKEIEKILKWLNITWDEGPYYQSNKIKYYQSIIKNMINKKLAYKCYCSKELLMHKKKQKILKKETPHYDRTCRYIDSNVVINKPYTVRFRNPLTGSVSFYDEIRGKIEFQNNVLDDVIIQRSDGIPTYNFCVVIDDKDTHITHVIRGEEHLNNTPYQINILKSMKLNIPKYAHLSMIIDENGKKISKRNNNFSILHYYKQGFLPEAILNYVIRLGWSHGDKEIFSIQEMKDLFSLNKINKSSSIFQLDKLLWMNKYYINNTSQQIIKTQFQLYLKQESVKIYNETVLDNIIELLKPRCNTIQQMVKLSSYFFQDIKFNTIKHCQEIKNKKIINILKIIIKNLCSLNAWSCKNIMISIKTSSIQTNYSIKNIYILLRIILTGKNHSPNISSIIKIFGKKLTILKILKTINNVKKQ
ncbi:glutamate--tRNA ligase [Buchnera aphidicola]|uniref:Glutamate--tRNA ligase n=1 Tax=Buchnera aphidicola (Anoecia oenotherae) TaxID=1241833 RepID=A0A4D6XQ97_9GAMM|nr:glutamate--tRNA ligase [Buchnera aphidicola]QCI19193.1 glutamate--tRNA ligase [Buchnera aphidicola (Anoecia oenotherae)]